MDDDRLLIERLVHGEADGADQVRLLAELGAVRNGADADTTAVSEADAHAIAVEMRRERRHEGGGGGGESLFAERHREEIQRGLQPLLDGDFVRVLVAEERDLQPGRAPVELPQGRLELRLRTCRDLERDHATDRRRDHNRVGDVNALPRAGAEAPRPVLSDDDAAALGEGVLGDLGEVLDVAPSGGPERGWSIALLGAAQNEHTGGDTTHHAALQREPRLVEGERRGGLEELSPGDLIDIVDLKRPGGLERRSGRTGAPGAEIGPIHR